MRPVTTWSEPGETNSPLPSSKTQWAAVTTMRGATSEPPQNWRSKALPPPA